MTTSITDARFTSLHFTPSHLLSLEIDEPPETGWGVMPGFDESIPVPPALEPPRLDADETLPSQLHPSYPFGRPPTIGKPVKRWQGPGNLLGTIGNGSGSGSLSGGGSSSVGRGRGDGGAWLGSKFGREERWEELGMTGVVESEKTREIPPGMAGAKRPPSPPSPALRPSQLPQPRSQHLRNLLDRQRQASPPPAADPFDAPVPNETYDESADRSRGEDGGAEGIEGAEGQDSMSDD